MQNRSKYEHELNAVQSGVLQPVCLLHLHRSFTSEGFNFSTQVDSQKDVKPCHSPLDRSAHSLLISFAVKSHVDFVILLSF